MVSLQSANQKAAHKIHSYRYYRHDSLDLAGGGKIDPDPHHGESSTNNFLDQIERVGGPRDCTSLRGIPTVQIQWMLPSVYSTVACCITFSTLLAHSSIHLRKPGPVDLREILAMFPFYFLLNSFNDCLWRCSGVIFLGVMDRTAGLTVLANPAIIVAPM